MSLRAEDEAPARQRRRVRQRLVAKSNLVSIERDCHVAPVGILAMTAVIRLTSTYEIASSKMF